MTNCARFILTVAAMLACGCAASGNMVGPAESLQKLTSTADIIFKGMVISNEPVRDASFERYTDFEVVETRFKIISTIKGNNAGETLQFRHYDIMPGPQMDEPQFYHFEPGRSYIVFGGKTGKAGIFQQAWKTPRVTEDQGALLCADNHPVTSNSVKEIYWDELTALLKSADVNDVKYAIRQIDNMGISEEDFSSTHDFDRKASLAAIMGLVPNPNPEIAQAAISVIGSGNPYLTDDSAPYWLASVGSGDLPGLGTWDPHKGNPGGELYWKELAAIADNQQLPTGSRAAAIRALGLVREPSLRARVDDWLHDPAPDVRASATLLQADFPGPDAILSWTRMATDKSPEVRACVAVAAGFAQQAEFAGVLATLLKDDDPKVRQAAAMSLLSFSPKDERIAKVFRENLGNAEFQPLFLNGLAKEQPDAYLDGLARAISDNKMPGNWWGGSTPAFESWKILRSYLRAQPPDVVRSGKLDRYLDALEKVGNYSSGEPCEIYAFYLLRGMETRAKSYREKATKASRDVDYFFRLVDQNPSVYDQE